MIYQGPNVASKISNELIDILKNEGAKNISEVVGTKN
jgi:dihydroorotate dehydrogenase